VWNIRGVWDLKDDVRNGRIPKVFYESDDENRRVPIVWKPEDFRPTRRSSDLVWNIRGVWDLKDDVRNGRIPKVFYESDDENRRVPIVWKPEDFMIAVSGDPLRNNMYVFAHNGFLGYPTGKKIDLPRGWDAKLAAVRKKA